MPAGNGRHVDRWFRLLVAATLILGLHRRHLKVLVHRLTTEADVGLNRFGASVTMPLRMCICKCIGTETGLPVAIAHQRRRKSTRLCRSRAPEGTRDGRDLQRHAGFTAACDSMAEEPT